MQRRRYSERGHKGLKKGRRKMDMGYCRRGARKEKDGKGALEEGEGNTKRVVERRGD